MALTPRAPKTDPVTLNTRLVNARTKYEAEVSVVVDAVQTRTAQLDQIQADLNAEKADLRKVYESVKVS